MARILCAGLLLLLSSPVLAGGDPATDLVLTFLERNVAFDKAIDAMTDAGVAKGKMVATSCEVLRDRKGGKVRRMVLVTFYRYHGDVAILTSIDAERGWKIVSVEEFPHMPTSLAPSELAAAEKLARADVAVAAILAREIGGEEIEVDALVHHTADAESPVYHHRVVRLFFRRGRDYLLYGPVVEVDLTTEKVRVEKSKATHK